MMSDFEKLAVKIKSNNPVNPIFKDRNKDTQLKYLSDEKIEGLRKQIKSNVENIKQRNDWLEASKRKKYEMEYERINQSNKILNKDPNATSIKNLLEDRMSKLKDLADESVSGIKHEIYDKGEVETNINEEPQAKAKAKSKLKLKLKQNQPQ